MNRILHRTYDGLIPRLEPSGLPENAAQIAQNVDLRRGVLSPIMGRALDTRDGAEDLPEGTKTIYLWRYTDYLLTTGATSNTAYGPWAALAATSKFKVTIDDVVHECNPDFTDCTTMDEVAAAIRDAIQAETEGNELVLYDASSHKFTIQAARTVEDLVAPAAGTSLATSSWLNPAGVVETAAEGEKWLTWTEDVSVVVGPINDDQYSRVYYTGNGIPKMNLRIGGEDVTRDIKIEIPDAPVVDGTAFVEGEPSAAQSAFTIEAAKLELRINRIGEAGVVVATPSMSFTQTGDTITIANGVWVGAESTSPSVSVGSNPYLKVNGVWYSANNGDTITSPDGTYKMVVQWTNWIVWFDSTPPGGINAGPVRYRFTWHGSMRLVFQTASTGESDTLDASVAISYCAAFVTDIGEEGPLSPATEPFLAQSETTVNITTVPQPALGVANTRGIVLTRLYRAAGGVFRWLADVPVGTSTYDDTTIGVDDDLGEEADELVTNPPDDLQGIIACTGGWYAAFRGREFLASQANKPTSWPDAYRLTLQHPIVALASAGNDVFVMTEGRPAVMSGSDPATLTQANIECDQACVSAAGVVVLGQTVIYPSPDGLVAMYAGAAKVVTAEWFRREDWQALVPTAIRAAAHDGRYYAALTGLESPLDPYMLIVDFSESVDRMTTADAVINGLYADLLDDALYAIEDGNIVVWQGGADPERIDWQGRDWVFPQPVSFAALRVLAASYATGTPEPRPVVTLYAAGTQVWQGTVAAAVAKKLPRLRPERRWSLRVQSRVEVTEVNLATGIGALTSG